MLPNFEYKMVQLARQFVIACPSHLDVVSSNLARFEFVTVTVRPFVRVNSVYCMLELDPNLVNPMLEEDPSLESIQITCFVVTVK